MKNRGRCAGADDSTVVGEKLGRKKMLIIFTIIMTAGIIFQTVATEMNHLIWGRLIAGIGNGGKLAFRGTDREADADSMFR